ncbi:MAG: hypothetical protein WA001_04875 [Patescibacteria group bacterium]
MKTASAIIVSFVRPALLLAGIILGCSSPEAIQPPAAEVEECDSPYETHYYGEVEGFTVSIDESVHDCNHFQVVIVRPKEVPIYDRVIGLRDDRDGVGNWERLIYQDHHESDPLVPPYCSQISKLGPSSRQEADRSVWEPCYSTRAPMLSPDEAAVLEEELNRMMAIVRDKQHRISDMERHQRIWGDYGNLNVCW